MITKYTSKIEKVVLLSTDFPLRWYVPCHEWVVRSLKWSLRGFARKDFTENLENVILQSLLARFTLLLIKWVEYKIEGGFEWKMICTE